jgi:hypothetical protein
VVVALCERPLGFGEIVLPRQIVAAHVAKPPARLAEAFGGFVPQEALRLQEAF